jgi:inner membrane protein
MDERHEILWNEGYFSLGISDNRGLKGSVSMKTDSAVIEAVPGLRDNELFNSGITFPAALDQQKKNIGFSVALQISGSGSMNFTPVGKTTKVNLASTWNAPGFTGNFLPSERTIDDKGFRASWIVTNLNRNFPQYWSGNSYKPENDNFGTEFVLQADHYQKALRSAKYGILFIALTFMALLFAEMTAEEKINVFHYLEMALGLVLFFSMLNALSEHIGFNAAYLLAAASTIALITAFLMAIIHNRKNVLMIGGMLAFLYAFIFVLLTLKDYAYLAGNIGLFILLAITMRLSLRLKKVEN